MIVTFSNTSGLFAGSYLWNFSDPWYEKNCNKIITFFGLCNKKYDKIIDIFNCIKIPYMLKFTGFIFL